MAVLKCYCDESGKDNDPQHTACSVAGYVGSVDAWTNLEIKWSETLKSFDVPYLHMREVAHFIGPFQKWKNNSHEREEFLKSLINNIKEANLRGIGAVVRLNDLNKFNQKKRLNLGSYEIGLYACLIEISIQFPDDESVMVLDRRDNQLREIAQVQDLASNDQYYKNCGKNVNFSLFSKNDGFKSIIGIQVADFGAWEILKNYRMKSGKLQEMRKNPSVDWLDDYFRNFGTDDLDAQLWTLRMILYQSLPSRQSYSELMKAADFEGAIWTYDTLNAMYSSNKRWTT